MQDMHDQAVGWYRDPGHPKLHRYWNGHSWVGPETLQGRLPRQATPRRIEEQTEATFDFSALSLDAQNDV